MGKAFTDILQKFISEHGKEALLNESKCKTLLADYTKGEFKKESRLLLQAHKARVLKAINTTQELASCKKQQALLLHEEYGLDKKSAADIVNALAFVLRGDTASEETHTAFEFGMNQNSNKAAESNIKYFNDYINSGYTYFWKGDYNSAIKEYDEAVRLEPDSASGYNSRGSAYLKKGQESMEALKRRSMPNEELNKEFKEVIENLEKAIGNFKDALSREPDDETAKKMLMNTQEEIKVHQKYIEARTALANGREDMLRIAKSLMEMGI